MKQDHETSLTWEDIPLESGFVDRATEKLQSNNLNQVAIGVTCLHANLECSIVDFHGLVYVFSSLSLVVEQAHSPRFMTKLNVPLCSSYSFRKVAKGSISWALDDSAVRAWTQCNVHQMKIRSCPIFSSIFYQIVMRIGYQTYLSEISIAITISEKHLLRILFVSEKASVRVLNKKSGWVRSFCVSVMRRPVDVYVSDMGPQGCRRPTFFVISSDYSKLNELRAMCWDNRCFCFFVDITCSFEDALQCGLYPYWMDMYR